jgi:DNA-binding GntR family transcriptional regulator
MGARPVFCDIDLDTFCVTAETVRAALTPRTKAIVVALLQTSDRYTRLQLSNTKAMGKAEKEHAHLIELCRVRETEKACRFLEQHIEAVRTDLLQVVGGISDATADFGARGASAP